MITSKELADIQRQIESQVSPMKGKLRLNRHRNSYQFYLVTGREPHGQYIPRGEAAIRVQQEYLALLAAETRRLMRNAEELEDAYGQLMQVRERMHPAKAALVTPLIDDAAGFAEDWQRRHPQRQRTLTKGILTNKGELVRSKSEKIIADKLAALQIPYQYEPTVDLYDQPVIPDFLVLNPRTRREFLWEHLGMIDLPAYNRKAIAKLNAYMKTGYFPGQNLILSFETDENPLDVGTVDLLIQTYLS